MEKTDLTRKIMYVSVTLTSMVFTVFLIFCAIELKSTNESFNQYLKIQIQSATNNQEIQNRLSTSFISFLDFSQKNSNEIKENAEKVSTIMLEPILYMTAASLEQQKIITVSESKKIRDESIAAIKAKSPRWGQVIEALGEEVSRSITKIKYRK